MGIIEKWSVNMFSAFTERITKKSVLPVGVITTDEVGIIVDETGG